jgi:hypothetical protein
VKTGIQPGPRRDDVAADNIANPRVGKLHTRFERGSQKQGGVGRYRAKKPTNAKDAITS